MNRRTVLVGAALLLLVVAGVFFIWPRETGEPKFRLKTVRHSQEQGNPVVFFRIVGPRRPQIQVTNIRRVREGTMTPQYIPEFDAVSAVLWTPYQKWPFTDPKDARKEFWIMVPNNAAVWKLQVTILVPPSWLDRFKMMPRLWQTFRKNGSSFLEATWESLKAAKNWIPSGSSQVIESEAITNAIPGAEPVERR
jgi:hypothetical protein